MQPASTRIPHVPVLLGAAVAVTLTFLACSADQPFPAFPLDLPTVADLGGPRLAHPDVIVLIDDTDPRKAALQQLMTTLPTSQYWSDAVSEYGVGPLGQVTFMAPPSPLPTSLSATELDLVVGGFAHDLHFRGSPSAPRDAGADAAAPDGGGDASPGSDGGPAIALHSERLYVLVLPETTTVTDAPCGAVGGYHFSALATPTDAVPYAVLQGVCTAGFGQYVANDTARIVLSHELAEAATNPFPVNAPGLAATDDAHAAWFLGLDRQTEVGDLCGQTYVTPQGFPETEDEGAGAQPIRLQAIWSNRKAAAGKPPCSPGDPVFFVAMPLLVEHPKLAPDFAPPAVSVGMGESVAIFVRIATDREITDMTLTAVDVASTVYAQPVELAFSGDGVNVRNGDVVRLQITRVGKPATFGIAASVFGLRLDEPGGGTHRTSYGFASVPLR